MNYFDSNNCGQSFHVLARDGEDHLQAYHADDSVCEGAEFQFPDLMEAFIPLGGTAANICKSCGGRNGHSTPFCRYVDLRDAIEPEVVQ